MFDIHHHFSLNQQLVVEHQCVLGVVHRSFDGILDGNEAEIYLVRLHGVKNIRYRSKWNSSGISQIGLGQQRLLSEGSCRTKETNSTLRRHV